MTTTAAQASLDGLGSPAYGDRAGRMQRALRSYTGTPKKPLFVRVGEPDDNLILSLGRLVVDKGTSFLFGQDVPSQVGGPGPERAQDWLDECWRRNRRGLTLQKLATNGAICGHAFCRLLEGAPYPRAIVLDPQTVDVVTDPDDTEGVWRYVIMPPPQATAEGEAAQRRRTVITTEQGEAGYRLSLGRPETWTIYDQTEQGGGWVTTATQRWPYPFSPIVDCQNLPKPNDYWGESDLPEDVLHVLDGINRVASHYNKIIRLHAHPKVWTRGMGQRVLDIAIDSVINLPSETAEMHALEMQSDLSSTMALLEKLLNILSMMVRVPLVAMGMPDNLGAISGVALQIRYQPLIEKTELKRRTYGDAVCEIDRRMLAMGGFGEDNLTTLQWPDIMPSDPLEARQVAVLDDSLGLCSKETLARQMNYDYAAEQKLIAQEQAARAAQQAAAGVAAPGATGPLQQAGFVPAPAPLQAPLPDIAKTAKSR